MLYAGNGCKYHSDCFTCPFPNDCMVDILSRANIVLCRKIRQERIGKLLGKGKIPREIAMELNIPLPTVRKDIIAIREKCQKL